MNPLCKHFQRRRLIRETERTVKALTSLFAVSARYPGIRESDLRLRGVKYENRFTEGYYLVYSYDGKRSEPLSASAGIAFLDDFLDNLNGAKSNSPADLIN